MICEYCRISTRAKNPGQAAYIVTVQEDGHAVMRARVCATHRTQLVKKFAPEPAKPWSHEPGAMTGEFINPRNPRFRVVVEQYSAGDEGEEGAA